MLTSESKLHNFVKPKLFFFNSYSFASIGSLYDFVPPGLYIYLAFFFFLFFFFCVCWVFVWFGKETMDALDEEEEDKEAEEDKEESLGHKKWEKDGIMEVEDKEEEEDTGTDDSEEEDQEADDMDAEEEEDNGMDEKGST